MLVVGNWQMHAEARTKTSKLASFLATFYSAEQVPKDKLLHSVGEYGPCSMVLSDTGWPHAGPPFAKSHGIVKLFIAFGSRNEHQARTERALSYLYPPGIPDVSQPLGGFDTTPSDQLAQRIRART